MEIGRQFDERDAPHIAVSPAHGWVAVGHNATTRPDVLGATFAAQPAGARTELIALASGWCFESDSFAETADAV